MYISVVGAVITIALNLILIPKMGFIAAAWTTLIAYGAMMIISYIMGQKHYKVPYNLPRIGLYICVAIVLSGLSYLKLKENYYLSITILLSFITFILVLERKELKQLLNKK